MPEGGGEGVLVAFADRRTSTELIPTGDVTLTMRFDAEEARPGTVRNVTLDLAPRAHDEEFDLHESTAQAALAHGAAG